MDKVDHLETYLVMNPATLLEHGFSWVRKRTEILEVRKWTVF